MDLENGPLWGTIFLYKQRGALHFHDYSRECKSFVSLVLDRQIETIDRQTDH